MRDFRWRGTDHLERRLRAERPVPSHHLVDEVVSRIEGSRPTARSSVRRLGLAVVAGAVMLIVFAAFGGVGSAASGVSGAAASTVNAVSTLVSPEKNQAPTVSPASSGQRNGDNGNGGNGNGNGNGDDECEDDDDNGASEEEYCKPRVTICHVASSGRERTLTLPPKAAARHLRNHPRDHPGPCTGNDDD